VRGVSCATAVQIKHAVFIGLVLCAPGYFSKVQAEEMLYYQDISGQVSTVKLVPTDKSWELSVTNPNGSWNNPVLFPLQHPLDGTPLSSIELVLKVSGFMVRATYPVKNLIERIEIGFEEDRGGKASNCPLMLSHFRREQRYAPGEEKQGQLRSGIEADFNSGMARILAIEGQTKGIFSVPVPLLEQERSFCSLPSVLEFTPLLNVPKVR
jgi:hypothetical protein